MQLNELTIHELSPKLREDPGKINKLVDALYGEIEKKEDSIGAYLQLPNREDLIKKAKEKTDSPLAGIPGAIKDNIQTVGMKTTCGSKILADYDSVYDATVVKKLKEKGSPILGKANMDEFAMGSSTENSAFQITKNPLDTERVPGGSSGGSAAAVASDEAIYALGSDTGGSIRQPAAFCGVVGLKPTYGLVSRYGLTAFASSLDQIGPITKDVRDAAIVLNYITGNDKLDSTSTASGEEDYEGGLEEGIKGATVGFPEEYFDERLDENMHDLADRWKKTFEELGVEIVDISLPHTEYATATYYLIACSEASANLARFDGVRYTARAKSKKIDDLFANSREEGLGPEVKRRIMLGTYALSTGYYDQFYKKAQKVRNLVKKDFDRAWEKVDLIATPTTPAPAFKLGEKVEDPLEMYLSDIFTETANLAGIPAISIPAGEVKDLPVGLQLMTEGMGEKKLLKAAHAIEKSF